MDTKALQKIWPELVGISRVTIGPKQKSSWIKHKEGFLMRAIVLCPEGSEGKVVTGSGSRHSRYYLERGIYVEHIFRNHNLQLENQGKNPFGVVVLKITENTTSSGSLKQDMLDGFPELVDVKRINLKQGESLKEVVFSQNRFTCMIGLRGEGALFPERANRAVSCVGNDRSFSLRFGGLTEKMGFINNGDGILSAIAMRIVV